jgi:hypothetical protein
MINASILSSLDTLTSYLSGEKKKGLLSSSADNSTSRLESLLSISPASAKPGKKICFRQYMHKPRDCIAKKEYHVKFRP